MKHYKINNLLGVFALLSFCPGSHSMEVERTPSLQKRVFIQQIKESYNHLNNKQKNQLEPLEPTIKAMEQYIERCLAQQTCSDQGSSSSPQAISSQGVAIPNKFHYVWLGDPLRQEYWQSLIQLTSIVAQQGTEVDVWVDDINNLRYLKEEMSDTTKHILGITGETTPRKQIKPKLKRRLISSGEYEPIDENTIKEAKLFLKSQSLPLKKRRTILNPDFDRYVYDLKWIKIRHIDELRHQCPDFISSKGYQAYWRFIDSERVGLKNFAAASDLLRMLILYVQGGVYLDTDIPAYNPFKRRENSIVPLYHPFGFAKIEDNNCLLSSAAHHPILSNAILRTLNNYLNLENHLVEDFVNNSLIYPDYSRFPLFCKRAFGNILNTMVPYLVTHPFTFDDFLNKESDFYKMLKEISYDNNLTADNIYEKAIRLKETEKNISLEKFKNDLMNTRPYSYLSQKRAPQLLEEEKLPLDWFEFRINKHDVHYRVELTIALSGPRILAQSIDDFSKILKEKGRVSDQALESLILKTHSRDYQTHDTLVQLRKIRQVKEADRFKIPNDEFDSNGAYHLLERFYVKFCDQRQEDGQLNQSIGTKYSDKTLKEIEDIITFLMSPHNESSPYLVKIGSSLLVEYKCDLTWLEISENPTTGFTTDDLPSPFCRYELN